MNVLLLFVLWLFLTVPWVGLQCVIVGISGLYSHFFYQILRFYNIVLKSNHLSGEPVDTLHSQNVTRNVTVT